MAIKYTAEDLASHDGVAAVIKNDKGEILMQEHVKYGFWTIPVGKVKEGQNIIDGLKQEILEECNLEVLDCQEIACQDYNYERAGNTVKVISHLFEIAEFAGELKNAEPHKHKQQVFMSIDQIINLPYLSDLTLLYLSVIGIKRKAQI